jgi:hypothetical protein
MTEAEWQVVGNQLKQAGGSIMWWLGDWWAYGENHEYGSRKKFVENWENGYSYSICAKAGSVACNIQSLLRSKLLPWSYHYAVAKLEPAQQKRALAWAEKNFQEINLRGFRDYIKTVILKKKVEDDEDDDDESDPEKTEYQAFMETMRATLDTLKYIKTKPFKFKGDNLSAALRSAQKVATAWNELVEQLKEKKT